MATLIDISRTLSVSTPVWPGDVPVALNWNSRLSTGDPANVSSLTTGVHAGTHVDAPRHLFDDGPAIAALPLHVFVGPAIVVDVRGRAAIYSTDLSSVLAVAEEIPRVLLRTGAWEAANGFPTAFAALTAEAVDALIGWGVRLIGTDAPSVDPFDSTDLGAHRALLSAGVPILENLDLAAVVEGLYELIALPLKLSDSDASPVRAILRRP